jgi:hypothetical protein
MLSDFALTYDPVLPDTDNTKTNKVSKTEENTIKSNNFKINMVINIQKTWRDYYGRQYPLYNSLKKILSMPYSKNDGVASGPYFGHEKALENIFKEHGFHEQSNKLLKQWNIKRNDANWLENLKPYMDNKTYIKQPFGSQSSPDFIVKSNDNILPIEAKSSKVSFPQYNSGGVHPDYMYVFSSEQYNETTIYKGSSIMSPDVRKLIDDYREERRVADKKFNEKLDNVGLHDRGWSWYTRPMIIQSGGKSKCDYLSHKDRKQTEQDALNWVKDLRI